MFTLRTTEEGAIQAGPSTHSLIMLLKLLFIYHRLVPLITVVIISTKFSIRAATSVTLSILLYLTAFPPWVSGFVASDFRSKSVTDHSQGGLFLAIVALFIPPLSVLKRTGCDHHLFINIVLTLFGWTPGVLHAWYIILRFPDGRRAAEMRDDVRRGRAVVVQQTGAGAYYIPAHQETRYRY